MTEKTFGKSGHRLFGLIGYPLGHSFSKKYFGEKFASEGIADASYELFPLENIDLFPQLLRDHPQLRGLNVTIPYKEQVIPFLDALDPAAAKIGAVNVIDIRDGKLTGYNTDAFGFLQSLKNCFNDLKINDLYYTKALVLGTGGASKAVCAMLEQLGISYRKVSRSTKADTISYQDLDETTLAAYKLIVNTTPLGTHPKTEEKPEIPYSALTADHILYDLVYNPPLTSFLLAGKEKGCTLVNGLDMLYLQAEKAWGIWTGRLP